MNSKKYFEKNGFIYGVSSKFSFGRWNNCVHKFYDYDEAIEWLYTEEYDFRERELMSKTAVKNLSGNIYFAED